MGRPRKDAEDKKTWTGYSVDEIDRRCEELGLRLRGGPVEIRVTRLPGHEGPPRRYDAVDYDTVLGLLDPGLDTGIAASFLRRETGWSYRKCGEVLREMCLHGLLVRAGTRVAARGRPQQLYARPASQLREVA